MAANFGGGGSWYVDPFHKVTSRMCMLPTTLPKSII